MKFLALYYQSGGCDYTIGCGHLPVFLPEEVDTWEKARAWLDSDKDDTPFYCGKDRLDKVTLIEVSRMQEFHPDELDVEV